ncbi:hypothetical protein [Providencia sp. Me31A]|uniref:hypothetical protein n=1 Tax=Providencia sp. Me31A TaxID=3392637 RepID=UPI003D2831E6
MLDPLDKVSDIVADFLSNFKWRTAVMIIFLIIVLISGFHKLFILSFFFITLILYSPEIWRFMSKKRKLNNPVE